jgi:DNA-binding Xre family transcriptional regulator
MEMRVRLPELLEARGMTAYALSRESKGRITMSMAYRLVEKRGRLSTFAAGVLEGLCTALAVTPGELFETDAEEAARHATERPARKRGAK